MSNWNPAITPDQTVGGTFTSYFPTKRYDDGCIIEERPVTAVKLARQPTRVTNWNQDEAGIEMTFELHPDERLDFPPTLYIGGKYARSSADGSIADWGGMFKIRDLFRVAGIFGEPVDKATGAILPDAAQALVGKKLLYVRYPAGTKDGKVQRHTDDKVDAVGYLMANETFDEAADRLYERFLYDARKGFPKNYRPQNKKATGDGAPDGQQDAFQANNDVWSGSASGDDLSFTPDDDLPFK